MAHNPHEPFPGRIADVGIFDTEYAYIRPLRIGRDAHLRVIVKYMDRLYEAVKWEPEFERILLKRVDKIESSS